MKNSISIVTYLSISTSVVLWGFSFIGTNSLLLQNFPVFSLIFFRILFAALILFVVSICTKQLEKIDKKDFAWFLLLAVFEPFIYFIGETFGLKSLNSPTLSSVIIATIPIFTLIAGRFFFKEKMSFLNAFGVFVTLPGIMLVVFEKGQTDISHSIGLLLLFLAVSAAVGYAVVVKRLSGKYNSYTIVTYQNIFGALYFLPFFIYFDYDSFSFHTLANVNIIGPLAFLSILCSSVAFILFVNSVKAIGITRSNIFTAAVPVVSAIAAFMIGQDGLNTRKVIGIAIVVAGVIIAQREKKAIKKI